MIKWEDVKIGLNILDNKIYLGKTRKDKSGLELWTDRSGDKTNEVVKAVMEYMIKICETNNTKLSTLEIKDMVRITCEDLRKK